MNRIKPFKEHILFRPLVSYLLCARAACPSLAATTTISSFHRTPLPSPPLAGGGRLTLLLADARGLLISPPSTSRTDRMFATGNSARCAHLLHVDDALLASRLLPFVSNHIFYVVLPQLCTSTRRLMSHSQLHCSQAEYRFGLSDALWSEMRQRQWQLEADDSSDEGSDDEEEESEGEKEEEEEE